MIAAGGGSIVNIGSKAVKNHVSAHTTAKSAVLRGDPHDGARPRAGIRVNRQVAGLDHDRTPEGDATSPEKLEDRQRQCLPDLIDPVYVARMVMFLASDDAALCSSNNYMVEAGSI